LISRRYLGRLESDLDDSRFIGFMEVKATHPQYWSMVLNSQKTDRAGNSE